MTIFEILALAIALSMDAFAVAICRGLCMQKVISKETLLIGGFFGGFQSLMPLFGYYMSWVFPHNIYHFGCWISFFLLSFLGIKMIKEANHENIKINNVSFFSLKALLSLAIATSIDAFAIGITFSFLEVSIWKAIMIIGWITMIISIIGVKIGISFGEKYGRKSQVLGGIILILIGVKIVLEHLMN